MTNPPPYPGPYENRERYLLDMFMNQWTNDMNDIEAGDFALYSTYEDTLDGINAWKYCKYNHPGIGFLFNCGPLSNVGCQWNAYTHHRGHCHANYHGFYVEKP